MLSEAGGPFINVERLDLQKYAQRPLLARVLCDYIIYNDHNMKRALDLCALATQQSEFQVGGAGRQDRGEGEGGGAGAFARAEPLLPTTDRAAVSGANMLGYGAGV